MNSFWRTIVWKISKSKRIEKYSKLMMTLISKRRKRYLQKKREKMMKNAESVLIFSMKNKDKLI